MRLKVDVLKSIIENAHLRGSNIYGKCPWCGFNEFGISIAENHQFGCFRKNNCGETGNIFKLLKKIKRTDLISKELIDVKQKLVLDIDLNKKEDILEVKKTTIKPPIGWRRVYFNEYLDSRIKNFDYEKYKVGITKLQESLEDYIVILIEENSDYVGYVSRYTKTILNKEKPKYKNSETDFSNTVFGVDDLQQGDKVIVVEGPFDKWAVDNFIKDLNLSKTKCVCTFGAKFSEGQKIKIKNAGISEIILMYESDVLDVVKETGVDLKLTFEKVNVCFLPEGEDPASIDLKTFCSVLKNKKEPLNFSFEKIKISKLKV
jgi:hypothetical protein